MLPTRAGELLIGAIVAHLILSSPAKKRKAGEGLSLIGAVFVLLSFIVISEEDVFPGFIALLPTVGTAFIIYSGQYKVTRLAKLLMWKPFVVIGLISYSAYLWHWPLIAFFNYGLFDQNWLSFTALLVFTLGLGWASYVFVEKPFRYAKWNLKKIFVCQLAVPSAVILCLSLIFMLWDGYGVRKYSTKFNEELTRVQSDVKPAYQYKYICQKNYIAKQDFHNEHCIIGAHDSEGHEEVNLSPDIILLGDSNAAHYVGMLGEFAKQQGFQFRNVQISACPPIMGDVEKYVSRKYYSDCRRSLKNLWSELASYQTIIISASWSHYQQRSAQFSSRVFATVEALLQQGKEVILLGKAPVISSYNQECLARAISFPFVSCQRPPSYLESNIETTNLVLENYALQTEQVEYYDANNFLCQNKNCSAYNKKGQAMYFDQSHLSIPGSWQLGKEIVRFEGVPYPFNLLGE